MALVAGGILVKEDRAGARRLYRGNPGMVRALVRGHVEPKDYFEGTVRYRRGRVTRVGCSGMIVRGDVSSLQNLTRFRRTEKQGGLNKWSACASFVFPGIGQLWVVNRADFRS